MIDSAKPLQIQYYSLLSGSITYDGSTVPVYDVIPSDATYPYIKIQERTALDMSTKTNQGQEVTQRIQIVDRYNHQTGTRSGIYEIGADVIATIRSRPIQISLTDFNVITATLDNADTRQEHDDKYTYQIYNLRFRHKLEEV